MKKISILFISLFWLSISAQETEKSVKKSIVSFDVLSPFAFDGSRYRIGYTNVINEKIRIGVHIGYGDNSIIEFLRKGPQRSINDGYSLFEIRPQFYYVLNQIKNVRTYVSTELVYLKHKQQVLDGFANRGDNSPSIRYKEADFEREKYGFLIHYGAFIPFGKSDFGINPHIGLGIRNRTNTFSNVILNTNDDFINDEDGLVFDFYPYFENQGTNLGLDFTIGAKIYYSF